MNMNSVNHRSNPALWPIGTSYRLEAVKQADEDLEALERAGIRYLELAWRNEQFDMFDPKNEQFVDSLIHRARARDLDIWTLHLPYGLPWDISNINTQERNEAVGRHLRLLRLAHRWSIGTVVLHPSWEPIQESERRERLSACKLALAVFAEEAERLSIRIAVECLPRTCLGHTSDEMAQLMEASDLIGICCDVNHLVQEPPEAFIQKMGDRIFTVHMSDNDGQDERHWMPGKGVIQWFAVLQELARAGYQGPFVFEVRNFIAAELKDCWIRLLDEYNSTSE
ncbi:sugar phosphate isomerase/epimerase family protein [Paenibacillus nasutitermitis]|uniref:Endonuclease n=1 Tax=Paenibacillus nasutitermitis TaxID=1652958 RepID=A0A917E414_9BACL|nr:sugar phosphate isomerase/epimerase [Paenibacillus nasutitermitis]GGE02708.1 endonuclease [Paenibacillus nasutitermitis]